MATESLSKPTLRHDTPMAAGRSDAPVDAAQHHTQDHDVNDVIKSPSSSPSDEKTTDATNDLEGQKKENGQEPPPKDGPPTHQQVERSKGKIALIMFALCLAVFLAALDITIVTTALPTIAEYFHSASGYVWIGSAFTLAGAAATPIWGKFSDIFGRKPVLLAANAVFFVGSLIAAVAISTGMLITGRAIQGVGGGGLITLVSICIGDLFSPRARGAYYGMIGGVWALASSLGPIIGGAFTEKVSWRWCFYINLPLDGLAFAIILIFLDVKTPKTPFWAGIKAIDWIGCALIVGATLMLLFGLQYGGLTAPWDSAKVICLIVFGVVTFALFFVYEMKFAKYPVIPTRIFRYRTNWAALGVCFWHAFTFIGGSYYLPLYFQTARAATPILSGVYLMPTVLTLSLASVCTGLFIRKTGQYIPPIIFGFISMTLGFGLFIDFDRTSSWAKIIIYQIIAGLGTGPNFQAPLIALQSKINPRDIGPATATFTFMRNIGTSVGIVIGGVIFQNEMTKQSSDLGKLLGNRVGAVAGNQAGANAQLIDKLPPQIRSKVQDIIAGSIHYIWFLYVATAATGLLTALLITKQKLLKTHEETKTGLEAAEENRQEALKENEERERKKRGELSQAQIEAGRAGPASAEKGN